MSVANSGWIEYNIVASGNVIAQNTVGPTIITGFRSNSNLPNINSGTGGKNDANTVYLRPDNGSDGNTGTSYGLDAVQTLDRAIDLAVAPRTTIHIEDTNTTLTLNETISTVKTLTNDLVAIQVAAGQTCTLNMTGGYYNRSLAGALPTLTLNGLEINHTPGSQFAPFRNQGTNDSAVNYEWCRVYADRICLQTFPTSSQKYNEFVIRDPGTATGTCITLSTTGSPLDITMINCILRGEAGTVVGLSIPAVVATASIDLSQITYVNMEAAIEVGALTTLTVLNNSNSIVHNVSKLAQYDPPATGSITVGYTNSLINVGANDIGIPDSTCVLNKNPLFIDELGNDYQLAHTYKQLNGINFPVNSPAVGIGTSSKDAGAYQSSYSALTETSESLVIPEDASIATVTLKHERKNYKAWDNLLGDRRHTWDDVKQVVEIKFSSRAFLGNDFSLKLAHLLRQKTHLRFYPDGTTGVYRLDVPGTYSGGVFDMTGNIPRDMIKSQYKGWAVYISWLVTGPTSQEGIWLIDDNDGKTLTLGTQISGDSTIDAGDATDHTAAVRYLPCILDAKDVVIVSEDYNNEDAPSDADNDPEYRPFYKRNDTEGRESQDWHTRMAIKLMQTGEDSLL